MRLNGLALFCLFTLAPAFAQAAPQKPDAEAFATQFGKVRSWDDVIAQLKNSLPTTIVNEFQQATKGVPFPTLQVHHNSLILAKRHHGEPKNRVQFADEATGRLVTIDFLDHGEVTINGKPWKVDPLATTQEEIDRLDKFLREDEKTGWLPSFGATKAWASASSGTAALSHVAAFKWLMDNCASTGGVSEQNESCTLAAAKQRGFDSLDEADFLAISMKCPSNGDGTFTLVSKNKNGASERIIGVYKKHKLQSISLATANKGATFNEKVSIDISKSLTAKQTQMAAILKTKADPIVNNICEGNKGNQKRYSSFLQDNSTRLSAGLIEEKEYVDPSTDPEKAL